MIAGALGVPSLYPKRGLLSLLFANGGWLSHPGRLPTEHKWTISILSSKLRSYVMETSNYYASLLKSAKQPWLQPLKVSEGKIMLEYPEEILDVGKATWVTF